MILCDGEEYLEEVCRLLIREIELDQVVVANDV